MADTTRTTQLAIETITTGDKIRVTQLSVEVIFDNTIVSATKRRTVMVTMT